METTTPPPVRKYKTFQYRTSVAWKSERQGFLRSDGKPEIFVSSPPEFKGIPGVWSPEDLFVASVEICTMSTFLSFGGRNNIPLKSYDSTAVGTLEHVDGNYRFTTITVRPRVVVGTAWTREQVEEVFRLAHDHCLIANSMSASVQIEPTIIFE